jgi:predicted acyltransferase
MKNAVNQATINAPRASRLDSLDVLRGLNILVMLFVNDIAGVASAPGWMKHINPSSGDGYTFVDVVFPAFLFIAGMSLPLALEHRLARGASMLSVVRHILSRALILLLLGVFMVNSESISSDGWLDPRLWILLVYTGICLIWIAPAAKKKGMLIRRIVGGVLLFAMAFLYRGEGVQRLIELQPHWWGILGLIGWAYLVTALLYLLLRKYRLGFAAAIVLLYCLYFTDGVNFFSNAGGFAAWIDIGSMLGSHAAVTATGALLGFTLLSPTQSHRERIVAALAFAFFLGVAATMLHSLHGIDRMFIYNKNTATPPWCLISSAWTALIWAGVYWVIEVKGCGFYSGVLKSAGQNALFAFILGPIVYTLLELSTLLFGGFSLWGWLGTTFIAGLVRSLIFAVAAVGLTAWMQRRGLALRI